MPIKPLTATSIPRACMLSFFSGFQFDDDEGVDLCWRCSRLLCEPMVFSAAFCNSEEAGVEGP